MILPASVAEHGVAGRLFNSLFVAVMAGSALATPVLADPLANLKEERLRPGVYPAAPVPLEFAVPAEPGHPPFDIDWSVGLRGTFTQTNVGETFVTTLNPQFTATHDGRRADVVVNGSAEIAKPGGGRDADITGLNLGFSVTAPLDSLTSFTANGAIGMTQELAGTPGLAGGVVVPPEITTGTLGAGLTRQFGLFNVGLNAGAVRTLYGPTLRSDTGLTNNDTQNTWTTNSSLRVGYQITPIFEIYGQGGISRTLFDLPGTGTTIYRNATERTVRGGIAGQWNEVLSASAAVGVGDYDFDNAALADIRTELYEANLTFRPDPTLALSAGLSPTITPPGADSTGTARITHAATANIDYTVNSWLRLRASADWSRALTAGSGETENRWGVSAGADYRINSHTALSADYAFAKRDNSTTGLLDSHRVSLGVTVQR